MQENTNWYWDQKKQQQVIIGPSQTIVHPCLDVAAVKDVDDIPKIIYNINQAKKTLRKHTICLNDSDHDYILEEIKNREIMNLKKI